MKKAAFLIIIFIIINCDNGYDNLISDVNNLIEDEKYEIATDKLRTRLESKRSSDETISQKKIIQKRLLELSNDRNRVIWTEDKNIIFRDLANPLVKTSTFPQIPEVLSISSEAEHAVVSFVLPNNTGCRLLAISILEQKPPYLSDSYISCLDHPAINSDGNIIYYFMNDNLYEEALSEPKRGKLIISKEKFDFPFPGLNYKHLIYPIGKTFVIFIGNGGSYILYWFNPKNYAIEKLGTDFLIPKLYYGNGKNAFIVNGSTGVMYIREIKYSAYGRPVAEDKIPISKEEINPWQTTKKNEFLSGTDGHIYKWGVSVKKRTFPILCERFWGVARDYIIYENKEKELILANTEYSQEDWKLLDIYKKIEKKK